MTDFEASLEAAEYIRRLVDRPPRVALILGSGLGTYADTLEEAVGVSYGDIPSFASSSVVGHAGRLVVGQRRGMDVVAMQGRVHAYEGHDMARVVFPLRTMWQLGARTLVVTNAAGSLSSTFAPGDLMLISDHLNLTGQNPLIGENDERFGPRFPDMTEAYSTELRGLAHAAAAELGFTLREGIYAGLPGPSYETPAEIQMLRAVGADAVGMSTVPEVIAARHLGMLTLGISCITNLGAGLSGSALDHAEVTEVATRIRSRFSDLLDGILERLEVRS